MWEEKEYALRKQQGFTASNRLEGEKPSCANCDTRIKATAFAMWRGAELLLVLGYMMWVLAGLDLAFILGDDFASTVWEYLNPGMHVAVQAIIGTVLIAVGLLKLED